MTPENPDRADRLAQQSRRLLDESTHRLEPDIARRLVEARHHALRHRQAVARRWAWFAPAPGWIPAGGALASVAMVLLGLNFARQVEPATLPVELVLEVTELPEPELLEDLEFYAWLELEALDRASSLPDSPAS
jgi:hypothetical protein